MFWQIGYKVQSVKISNKLYIYILIKTEEIMIAIKQIADNNTKILYVLFLSVVVLIRKSLFIISFVIKYISIIVINNRIKDMYFKNVGLKIMNNSISAFPLKFWEKEYIKKMLLREEKSKKECT